MNFSIRLFGVFLLFLLPHVSQGQNVVDKYRSAAVQRWEEEIEKLEELDKRESYSDDSVLFIGSSSIRLWKTIEEDMLPYEAIRRGYGGAKFTDLAVFAERLIQPHNYTALVVFVANDVTGGENDTPMDDLHQLIRSVIATGKAHQPEAPVFLIEVTPTPSRFEAWPQIRKVNQLMRELALTEPNVYFIATAEHVLDADKQPRESLFVDDHLHLNPAGYQLWTRLVKQQLDEFVRSKAGKRQIAK